MRFLMTGMRLHPLITMLCMLTLEANATALNLNVDMDSGLMTTADAAKRLEQYGRNELESAPPVPAWKKFLLQLKDALVYLLIAATAISMIAMAH